MSAPVTITETTWAVLHVDLPLSRLGMMTNEDVYEDADAAKRDAERYNHVQRRTAYRVVRIDSRHTLTPLEPADAPQSDEGGADDH